MKKMLLALLSIAIAFTALAPAQAEDQKVLAIIDSAIDSTKFSSIIHEVCFTTVKSSNPLQNMSCPNGELFMEGPKAASAPWPIQKNGVDFDLNNGTFHGDSMVKAALATNPNIKIVFIRFNDVTSLGNSRGDYEALIKAIEWVSNNTEKYSIDALSISQSGVTTNTKTKAKTAHIGCTSTSTAAAVAKLNTKNVPVFAATGNDGLKDIVGFPACVPGIVGVGSSTAQFDNGVRVGETATNRGPGLDIVTFGKVSITKYNGSPTDPSGSSIANVITAAVYVNNNKYKTTQEYVDSLTKEPVKFVDYFTTVGKNKVAVFESVRVLSSGSK